MEPFELLGYVVAALERLGLRYLVTGSVATIYYGEPRFTNDIDIVAALPAARIAEFCRAFPAPEFYLSEEAVREAVRQGGQFNIIHPTSGLKVDVIIPEDTPFNRSRFSRGLRVKPVADIEASFASPEDVIIKKLEYYRDGGSEKHLRDIAGVLKISGDRLDRAYLAEWVARLGLDAVWQAVLGRTAE
jgi:hypothetical protein